MNNEIKSLQHRFLYPGIIVTLLGIIIFIVFSGSALSVLGIVMAAVGIFLMVFANGEIKDIHLEIKEKTILNLLKKYYINPTYSSGGIDVNSEARQSQLNIQGDRAVATNILYGSFRNVKFSLKNLSVTTSKYIRGDESGPSRNEVKSIFNGLFMTCIIENPLKGSLIIKAKKHRKKRYLYDGTLEGFYKHFKVLCDDSNLEKTMITHTFIESFYDFINKGNKIQFSYVDGRFFITIENVTIFNRTKINEKVLSQFEEDVQIAKLLISSLIPIKS